MKTKLTLSVDKELILFAKRDAQKQGSTISAMFSDFLLTKKQEMAAKAVPGVNAMVGTLKTFTIDDSKQGVRSAYAKKHSS